MVQSICGVILVSEDPAALAGFYAWGLGLAFEEEDHGGLDVHYGIDIGTVHFAIHPPGNFRQTAPSRGAAVAFAVDSVAASRLRVVMLGAEVVVPEHDEGFGPVVTLRDPDGNLFELVELSHDFGR